MMNINSVIKFEILTVCGGPVTYPDNLPDETPLCYLGYDEDEDMCKQLEKRLQNVAAEYQTGKVIKSDFLSANHTVSHCIDLVINS